MNPRITILMKVGEKTETIKQHDITKTSVRRITDSTIEQIEETIHTFLESGK